MLHKLRQRAKDERGFTLIELLVVILIIGILAAIAIPSFLNQKSKATDAAAKELAHSMQVAAETYATDNTGSYVGLTLATLNQYEATIQTSSGNGNAYAIGADDRSAHRLHGHGGVDERRHVLDHPHRRRDHPLVHTTVRRRAISGGCVNGTW